MNLNKKYSPVIGEQHGEWTIVDTTYITDKWGQKYFKVQCSCGYETHLSSYTLRKGSSTRCSTCKGKERFQGLGSLSLTYFNQLRDQAVKRKIEFNLTIEYAWNLFEKQKGICVLSGVCIVLRPNYSQSKKRIHTASLDRIDSTKGYIEGNIQWVHKDINQMKSNRTDEEFINWCKIVSNHNENVNKQ